jgi:glycosyltransferase involved in cell wall biosynthesis
VHSHHAWVDEAVCILLRDNSNFKVVVTTHGMYEMMSQSDLARVIPILNKRVNKFVYAADKNLSAFNSSIIPNNRFTKIDNALEISPIRPVSREDLGIDDEDFVLCLVSRAIPEKGWEEGIEAVRLARKQCARGIHLLLIGEGPEYSRLRQRTGYNFIHFLGFKSNIRDYFAASDIGFLPSRFQGESFPLVVIDCLLSGRPVLASNVGEIANMINTNSGPAGSVFALDNWRVPVKRLAEHIAEYATNKDLYTQYLRLANEAAKKFDPSTMLHGYEMVYQQVISEKGNGENHSSF